MTGQDQRLGQTGAVTTPAPARALPSPGAGELHNPAGRRSAPGARCRRPGQSPRPGARPLPARPRARIGPGQRPPPPPGTGWAPGLSVSGPGAPTTPETNTDTITKAATRRQHRGGRTGGPRGGWQSARLPCGGQGRPSRPGPPRGRRPAGRGRCLEVLLTLVRQLVELRHLERAAPLFQRLPAAVHCGAETVFAREVRMRSSLPRGPASRRVAPAVAG